MSPNTQRAYARQLGRFNDWCIINNRTSLPATGETLAEYVAALCDAGYSASTIEQAVATIRTAHRVAGHKAQPETESSRLVLRSHRKDQAAEGKRTRKSPPVTLDALRRMIDATSADSLIGVRDRVLLVLGFALMGRRSELAALNIADVTETEDGLEVRVKWSKTDQEAVGETVAIPRGSHAETDPVRVLNAYLRALKDHGVTNGPLLRSVTRWGRPGDSLSEDGINRAVRAAALRANLPNADAYTAHSLRSGGATASYRAGAPVSVIAAHGRWAEGSPTVLRYIRAVDKWTDNPLRGIGL
ncbi:MAG TPA: tyrosine-type recombinase/integrase [Actinocrinis sp.]|uniref:tyrosine-type recombinase/integrase n=1 Tax=Actinocrinis sp. TaxID=1920516 RepID=UPI002DDCDC81|nr:tyrosine-type recombinase/integrase [Actinocrinis sp.]HEV2344346.1 tyrosine-type recombinase/integrase [Actinocrinis sp.]